MKKSGYRNILDCLDRADAIDIDEGRVAYFRYRELCESVAVKYGYDLPAVVGVFAALSPNNDYFGNVRSMITVIEAHAAGVPDRRRVTVSTYGHCRDRAFTYLDGVSFLGTVGGKKIRSFYQNILNPLDPDPVTIDGHAVNIYTNKVQSVKANRKFNYEAIAADYRRAARAAGLIPHQIQAITWFCWKRTNRIIFDGQFDLFGDRSDNWKTLIDIDQIKPYGLKHYDQTTL